MRIIVPLVAIAISFTTPGYASEAQQVFDSLYGPRIKAAKASVDRTDDHALAKELLEAAGSSADTPALVALLCDASYDLASKHPDGFATAVQAMTLLAQSVEAQRTGAREKLVDVLMKQSRIGKTEEREPASEQLIDTLLLMGDEKLEAKKWTEATGDYRRAMTLAATRKSPKADDIKARMEESMRLDRVSKQIVRLQEKLLADANDHAAAAELVRLYVLELDDAAAAAPFLDRVKDESLRKIVPLASKVLGDLSADEAMMLGEWYRTQAAASPQNRDLWVKAHDHLARFLELNTDTGVAFTKATVMFSEAKVKMESLKPVPKPAPAARLPRNPLIAQDKHFGFTGFQKENNIYTLTAAAPIPAARTKLRYKAHTDGGPHSFGNIHVRLDDRDWVKVGQWSDVSLVESAKNEHWTTIDLTALPANVNARKMEVRFEYTSGGWRMQMYEVQWVVK